MSDSFIELDHNQVITRWDGQAERMFGWTAAEIIGRRSHLLVPERNRERYARTIEALLAAPPVGSVTQHVTGLHRSGREFKLTTNVWIAVREGVTSILMRTQSGRELVEALQEAEQSFRELIDRLEDGYFEVDLPGMFTSVNDAYCRMAGRPRDALIGRSFKDLLGDADEVKATREAYIHVYKTGEALKAFEHTVTRKDGTRRFVEDTVTLKRNSKGQAVGFIGIRRDCTERRLAAETLKQSEERYRMILDSIEDGYFEVDLSHKGHYVFVNDAFCRTTGYERDEILGQSYASFFDAGTAKLLYDAYRRVFLTGEPLKALAYAVVAKDGTRCFVEESVSLRRDASGAVAGFMGIRRDSTARTLAEQAIANAREAAEAANLAKSEFLANMSHEIRTPMNGIIGMTELALDTELSPFQIECLSTVRSSAESLLTILNDVLDFSKIESRKLDLEQVPFSLHEAVNDTVRPLAVRAHQKGLELIIDVSPEIPASLMGDPLRLRQVLTNLVGNAIKFTERGHVMVKVRETARHAGQLTLTFSVTDTGVGVPADKHATIFEAFRQADGSTTRRFGGTGLGLAISSTLVRMMGGAITVTSAPGAGSTFEFATAFPIPLEGGIQVPARRVTTPIAAIEPVRRVNVLVAEDNVVNQRVAMRLLERRGHTVTVAATGHQALDALGRQDFDVVLMDVQMPEMGGFEATAIIRAGERGTGRRLPIIAMTAHAMNGDRERCEAAGMDGYLSKPVDSAALFAAVEQHGHAASALAEPPAGAILEHATAR